MRVKLLWLLGGALASVACARPTDPRPTLGASTRDPEAEHAFRAAQTALDEGRPREAELRLRTFRERHPNDPLVPDLDPSITAGCFGVLVAQRFLHQSDIAGQF